MSRLIKASALILCMGMLCGCAEITEQVDLETISQHVETIAQQLDVESVISSAVEKINQEELKQHAAQGYDALVAKFPTLKGENIKSYLKDNGLELMNQYIQSTDAEKQETARKLGEIIKILSPELSDEVDAVICN